MLLSLLRAENNKANVWSVNLKPWLLQKQKKKTIVQIMQFLGISLCFWNLPNWKSQLSSEYFIYFINNLDENILLQVENNLAYSSFSQIMTVL